MAEKTVKQAYEEARKKYKLPTYKEIDSLFNISNLENTKDIVREIRKKIANRIENIGKQLEDILQPDTGVSNLYESQNFDESSKRKIFTIFRKFMYWHRSCLILLINNDVKADADFIKDVVKEWPDVKDEILPFLEKLKNVWIQDLVQAEKLPYFG